MDPQSINKAFQHCFPELASPYAVYPMARDKWSNPRETIDGKPGFIQAIKPDGRKPDYVWGRSRFGSGYYHLATIDSYKILAYRVSQHAPYVCCCTKAGSDVDLWDTTRRVLQARALSRYPNDGIARAEGVAAAQSQAQAYYGMQQDAQLVAGGVQGAFNLTL